jgi:hypothetical protein
LMPAMMGRRCPPGAHGPSEGMVRRELKMPTASRKADAHRCVYRMVMVMDAWPSSAWIEGMGVPAAAICEAKVWRSACQPTGRRLARFACAELHQDTITPEQIDKAMVVLFVREGGVDGSCASAATRNSRLAAIRAFFRFLLAEDRVARDPTASLHSAALPERAPTFLTAEEFAKVRRTVGGCRRELSKISS